MTAVAVSAAGHGRPGVTERRVLNSEWIKLRSLRSTWFSFGAAMLIVIGLGTLFSAIRGRDAALHHVLNLDATQLSLRGIYLAQLAVGVLGVLLITGEYATGMIRATLSATPRRLPVLRAKIAVFAVMTFVVTTAAAFIAFFVGQALLHSHGTTIGAPHALRAVLGVGLYLTVVGVLALSLGFVVRSTAGAIASVFGILLVLPALGHVLPSNWQMHLLPYLPSNAGGALYSLHPDPGTLSPWTGFAVMCAWAAAAVLAAAVVLRRRDA
jgi:ABC-2 type transport system permease protein